jgi:hypothetical protein
MYLMVWLSNPCNSSISPRTGLLEITSINRSPLATRSSKPIALNWYRTLQGQTHRVMLGSLDPDMTLASEIRELVEQCVRGDVGVHDMDRRLAAYVRRIAAAGDDAEARKLYGSARALDSEMGYGHRTEAQVRDELRRVLGEVDATYHSQAGTRP